MNIADKSSEPLSDYVEFRVMADNTKINSLFLRKNHKEYFDEIYNYLTEMNIQKDETVDENFNSKFHNMLYITDNLILGEYYTHDLPWKKGVSVDSCDHYLDLRESLGDHYNNSKDDDENVDKGLVKILQALGQLDTAAYVLVCHELRAHNCNYDNLDEMKDYARELLDFGPVKEVFERNSVDLVCEKLYNLYHSVKQLNH